MGSVGLGRMTVTTSLGRGTSLRVHSRSMSKRALEMLSRLCRRRKGTARLPEAWQLRASTEAPSEAERAGALRFAGCRRA